MVKLAPSARELLPGVQVDDLSDNELKRSIVVTVRLRRVNEFGAAQEEIAKVATFARDRNLVVVEESRARCCVLLRGTVADLNDAFSAKLSQCAASSGTYRGRTGSVEVPDDLEDIVVGVFGLDNRRQASPSLRKIKPREGAAPQGRSIREIAELYRFPDDLDGTGECIGLIEFGGSFDTSDIEDHFRKLKLRPPSITAVHVRSEKQNPGASSPASPTIDFRDLKELMDTEVALDIAVAGAVAPGARIVVYFAPFTSQGWVDVLATAVHDSENNPSVLSISWGWPEKAAPNDQTQTSFWTQQLIRAINDILQEAAQKGITVCCASGDDGSAGRAPGVEQDSRAHVLFPASSPYVLACGGTSLPAQGEERVWNDPGMNASGGGVSEVIERPEWQSDTMPKSLNRDDFDGRRVPDVAAHADGHIGYEIQLNGETVAGLGGTSAAAPLWAGLIARINQGLRQRVGYFNELLYSPDSAALRRALNDIKRGDNGTGQVGKYDAQEGWDACTGWGSPNGKKLLEELRKIVPIKPTLNVERNTREFARIMAAVWDDPERMKRLVADPIGFLRDERLNLSADRKVIVHEDDGEALHFIVPGKPALDEEEIKNGDFPLICAQFCLSICLVTRVRA